MLKRVKDNLVRGIEKIRWFATVFSERLKIEVAVVRLLFRSDEVEKRKDELLKSIGERVFELKGQYDKNILRDRTVVEAISEIERIEKEMDEIKHKVAEISSIRA